MKLKLVLTIENNTIDLLVERDDIPLVVNSVVKEMVGESVYFPGNVSSLRKKIEEEINTFPADRWTTQKMLNHLQAIGFNLRAQKPIYSVGQALTKLVEKGSIVLISKGAGSAPNVYISKKEKEM